MKIFIDFDDVLLNTGKFRDDYKNLFRINNIPEKIFEKYYYDYPIRQRNGGLKKYDSDEHLKRIKEKEKIKTGKLKRNIKKLLAGVGQYLFSDVRSFLRRFRKDNLYLVSYARTKFQENKIRNSGIKKYFRKVVIIDELKALAINKILKEEKLCENEPLYFLDDRVEQIEDVKKNYPFIITVFIKRKEGRYQDKKNKYCDFVAKNLKETGKIINRKTQN